MTFNPKSPRHTGDSPPRMRGLPPHLLLVLLALLFLLCIKPAHAPDAYNLTALPDRVAEHMVLDLFPAQMLCCGVMLLLCLIPTTIIARSKKSSWIPELAVTIIVLGFQVSVGWLNVFFLVIISFIIALMFAGKMREFITGR